MQKRWKYLKKHLTGGISTVNTRLGFDSNVLIKNKDQKLIYKIKNKQTGERENKSVVPKILKMDENNQ